MNLLGLKHPIFLAPMAGISTPELAAEVSNAGGLGSLGLGAETPSSARNQILATQSLTKHPFQVNFFCHTTNCDHNANAAWIHYLRPTLELYQITPPAELCCIYPSFLDDDSMLEVILETRPAAVSFHFGIPHPHQLEKLKKAGIIVMVCATNLSEARLIEAAGVDIIIAQGVEAGGHRGVFNPSIEPGITTLDLTKLLSQRCSIPIIAAGGVMNGHQAKDLIANGASAVQLGTAFIQCNSSNASEIYRTALFAPNPFTQISTVISGRPARGLVQMWQTEVDLPHRPPVAPYPFAYDLAKQLNTAALKYGESGYGAFWAGSNVAQIRELSAGDLMQQLIVEMEERI